MDMTEQEAARKFREVCAALPVELRRRAEALPQADQVWAEELRLRVGQPLFVAYPEREEPLSGTIIGEETLRATLELASGSSVHTVMDQVKNGFVPIRGGHRLGLCGTGVMKDSALVNLRFLSSVSLRVAREFPGIAQRVLPRLFDETGFVNTLICSPPGGGKTTLLRDLIRCLSDGEGVPPLRVGVADERGELAALWEGRPTLNIGARTDVMTGCPKNVGLITLLRGMSPQALAVDEITAPADADAIVQATGCGVKLLATAHASKPEDLFRRRLYRSLLDERIFGRVVWISGAGSARRYTVTDGTGKPC